MQDFYGNLEGASQADPVESSWGERDPGSPQGVGIEARSPRTAGGL
ncbi:hypothetical protein [Oxynema aestuarii]|uniref:Uncharacterized protein n=1 Tax=Oxynema aestuarii AP17 TaxID=2064643 RepID=A0A6H1TWD6_9CYAN|nr:hypothetical protein [Oxynema aestuarii]QIZ70755.1 hypothetical protein HCG48_09305 [Oxynema aestuarii AP17]